MTTLEDDDVGGAEAEAGADVVAVAAGADVRCDDVGIGDPEWMAARAVMTAVAAVVVMVGARAGTAAALVPMLVLALALDAGGAVGL